MTDLHEDPKLTAYALGEYEALAPGERESIEKQLADDAALRDTVEAIRGMGTDLERELAGEAAAEALTPVQKQTIERAAASPKAVPARTSTAWRNWGMGAAAALLAVAATIYSTSSMRPEADQEYQSVNRSTSNVDGSDRSYDLLSPMEEPAVTHEEVGVTTAVVPGPQGPTSSTQSPMPETSGGTSSGGGQGFAKAPAAKPSLQQANKYTKKSAIMEKSKHPVGSVLAIAGKESEQRPAAAPDGIKHSVTLKPVMPGYAAVPLRGTDLLRMYYYAHQADGKTLAGDGGLMADAVVPQAKGDPLKLVELKPEKLNAFQQVYFRQETVQQRIALLNKALIQEKTPAAKKRVREELDLARSILMRIQQPQQATDAERYAHLSEQPFKIAAGSDAVSTFSIDVDTASYSNVRRFLNNGQLPPADAVRIEEMVNYFNYAYVPPTNEHPFASHVEVGSCPWEPAHRLVRIGLKGRDIAHDKRPASNLVFLLDVSGSMNQHNKLPLVKQALSMLVQRLTANDRVAIVVYAGASGVVLPSTTGDQGAAITAAMNRLSAGGSTNGGAGIDLAYKIAQQHFIKDGVNRVILCTDGDFNVGNVQRGTLQDLIEQKAKSGVFLTVLGFGMGNYKDDTLETLADKGNGNYGYIDTALEARKMLVDQIHSTLITIAKDVKIQVEFNPAKVDAYRLIGYENRMLAREDFNDDTKDAGEIGAGHTVTALYEVVPAGVSGTVASPDVDGMRYQQPTDLTETAYGKEMLTLKLRYKQPDSDTSTLMQSHVSDEGKDFGKTTPEFRFASAVASFGMLLRNSKYSGPVNMEFVRELAEEAKGADVHGYRAEFLELVKKAATMRAAQPGPRR